MRVAEVPDGALPRASAPSPGPVAYDLVETPVGRLLVGASSAGLCRIAFEGERALDELGRRFGAVIRRSPRALARVRRELEEYFGGRRKVFEEPTDLSLVPAFQRRVLEELVRIPYGEVATYGAVAARVGNARAARAVGGACNRNPIPIVLPCHRVVGRDGSLVGYGGGLATKRALLSLEGAAV